ncbi:MAG: hypothetical protein RL062_269 [Bacteroidota bacterium]
MKFILHRWSGLTRIIVVAALLIAMLTSLTSYTFFEQSHCTTSTCEIDADLNEFDDSKLDGHFPLDFNLAGFGFIEYSAEIPFTFLTNEQKQQSLPFAMSKRYIAFHSLKVFC